MDTFEILSQLCSAAGVSGAESSAAKTAAKLLEKYGETTLDNALGSVVCKVGNWEDGKPVMLLDAHIDEIGMIVTYITEDGFLKISGCGGLDTRLLLAQQVTVYGREKLTGIVTSTPPHLEKDSSAAPDLDSIFIDIGFTSRENVEKYVSLGDRVLIENKAERLAGSRVTSKAIDNRSGCAAIIKTLELLIGQQTAYNIAVCFSTQEEVGERGAKTAAFDISADYAIVVDVSFAKTHYESEEECGIMGKGAMIGIAPSLSREMSEGFIRLAEEKGIPYQLEVMSGKTGTNADTIGVSGSGTKAVTISIPEKHMHTPVEIVDIKDIDNTALLIAEYLKRV